MDSCDCIVVGDDIAALSAAALIAGAGLKTLLVTQPDRCDSWSDLLLPCCRSALERLQLLEPLATTLTAPGQSLQCIDALGDVALMLNGGLDSAARFWRPAEGQLRGLLLQAAQQMGAQIARANATAEVLRLRSGEWRVRVDDAANGSRHVTAPLVVDTRRQRAGEATWLEIRGRYRSASDPLAAMVAMRALDGRGWCSLTPRGDGLVGVRIVCDEVEQTLTPQRLAELWEDRLVQAPRLLERLTAAELAGELSASVVAKGDCDPWGAFRDSCDLLLGEEIASRVQETAQSGGDDALSAPIGRSDASGAAAKIQTALRVLFGQCDAQAGGAGCSSEAIRTLNKALGEGSSSTSPFPPAGDEAILTRA